MTIVHHDSQSNSPCKCELCPEGFDRESNFIRHIELIHGGYIPYFQNVQSVILTPEKKIYSKNMSQKIIHIFRMSRVSFWHQTRKFVVKTCHRKSSIFSECPECDFETKEVNLLKKHLLSISIKNIFMKAIPLTNVNFVLKDLMVKIIS